MARPSPAMAVALAALVAAAAGSATAASRQLFTGGDIQNASLTGADVANASLTGADVRNGTIGLVDLTRPARRAIGASGSPGPQGPPGPPGTAGTAAISPPTPVASIGGDTQPIPSGTTTRVAWNEANTVLGALDPDGMHDDAVNADRLTPPSPGLYTVHVAVVWPANATGERELRIRRNLAAGGLQSSPVARQAADGSAIAQNGSFLVRIDPGDSVSVEVRQNSGVDLNLNPIQVSIAFAAPLR